MDWIPQHPRRSHYKLFRCIHTRSAKYICHQFQVATPLETRGPRDSRNQQEHQQKMPLASQSPKHDQRVLPKTVRLLTLRLGTKAKGRVQDLQLFAHESTCLTECKHHHQLQSILPWRRKNGHMDQLGPERKTKGTQVQFFVTKASTS